jgi:hypothetical protein
MVEELMVKVKDDFMQRIEIKERMDPCQLNDQVIQILQKIILNQAIVLFIEPIKVAVLE